MISASISFNPDDEWNLKATQRGTAMPAPARSRSSCQVAPETPPKGRAGTTSRGSAEDNSRATPPASRQSCVGGSVKKVAVGGAVDLLLQKRKTLSNEELVERMSGAHRWKRAFAFKRKGLESFLYEPHSSWAAYLLYWSFIVVTCASVIFVCLESVPREQQHLAQSTYDAIEVICTIVFTVELALHTLAAHSLRELRYDVFYFLNMLAAAPLYLDLIFLEDPGSSNLQPLRLMRVLKLARQYDGARVLVSALQRANPNLVPSPEPKIRSPKLSLPPCSGGSAAALILCALRASLLLRVRRGGVRGLPLGRRGTEHSRPE